MWVSLTFHCCLQELLWWPLPPSTGAYFTLSPLTSRIASPGNNPERGEGSIEPHPSSLLSSSLFSDPTLSLQVTSCQLQQMDLETWSCSQEGGADNDVIDTLIRERNVFTSESCMLVRMAEYPGTFQQEEREMFSHLNLACLFVWQNIQTPSS